MAPLLVTALVGIGVKIATDLLMAGAKQVISASGATSFASALDTARSASGEPAAATAGARRVSLDAGLADRSRILATEAGNGVPHGTNAYGFGSYRRMEDIAPQTV